MKHFDSKRLLDAIQRYVRAEVTHSEVREDGSQPLRAHHNAAYEVEKSIRELHGEIQNIERELTER